MGAPAAVDNVPTGLAVEEVPPKSLVIIWALMAAELAFDLVTTIIAFVATLANNYCCGSVIYVGPVPLSTTIPFFILILTELSLLARAVLLTLWPSTFASGTSPGEEEGFEVKLAGSDGENTGKGGGEEEDEVKAVKGGSKVHASLPRDSTDAKSVERPVEKPKSSRDSHNGGEKKARSMGDVESRGKDSRKAEEPEFVAGSSDRKGRRCAALSNSFCCCLKWNAKMVLTVISMLTIMNPFFACVIAWMLLYQSNRTESFVVLGLSGASIVLHFIGVRLEGGLRTSCSKLIHSVALIPFLVTVTMMLVYLREGGVCYSVESQLFLFSGCEVCEDGTPPVDGQCGNFTVGGSSWGGVVNVDQLDINNLGALTESGTTQDTFCSPEVNFCFYSF